ncbi:heterokaryon incompatibility protein-domain-containing protein, partial [Paraphoma chrysanthemicola]
FEAISYCWESDVRDQEVVVDNIKVAILTNLEALLQHLRHLPEAKSGMGFWIDGLCISQDQLIEKNHQVRLMKQIYEQAVAVIVWLGPGDFGSDMAIDFILQLADIQTEQSYGHLYKQHVVEWLNRDYQTPALWTALIDLWSRKYFGRMWIIQELALNSRMEVIEAASDFCMSYAGNLAQILSDAQQNMECPSKIIRNDVWECAYNINNLVELRSESTHLNAILNLARKSNVKDPKDKIYGLLGMVLPSLAQAIVPDYSKTVQEVYIQFALAVLEKCSHLDEVLVWCAIIYDGALPSWVPDWNSPFRRYHLRWFRRFCAAGDTSPTWSFTEELQQLHCKGILVDIVEATSSALSESLPYREVIKPPTLIELPARPPDTSNHNAQVGTRSDTLWKELQETLRRRLGSSKKPHAGLITNAQWNTIRLATVGLAGRRIITTKTGYLGLAPAETRPGDTVAILYGCRYPVILRPSGNGFKYVGECYIDGLTHGEAVKG